MLKTLCMLNNTHVSHGAGPLQSMCSWRQAAWPRTPRVETADYSRLYGESAVAEEHVGARPRAEPGLPAAHSAPTAPSATSPPSKPPLRLAIVRCPACTPLCSSLAAAESTGPFLTASQSRRTNQSRLTLHCRAPQRDDLPVVSTPGIVFNSCQYQRARTQNAEQSQTAGFGEGQAALCLR